MMLRVLRRETALYRKATFGRCGKRCGLAAWLKLFLTGLDYESVMGVRLKAVVVV